MYKNKLFVKLGAKKKGWCILKCCALYVKIEGKDLSGMDELEKQFQEFHT